MKTPLEVVLMGLRSAPGLALVSDQPLWLEWIWARRRLIPSGSWMPEHEEVDGENHLHPARDLDRGELIGTTGPPEGVREVH